MLTKVPTAGEFEVRSWLAEMDSPGILTLTIDATGRLVECPSPAEPELGTLEWLSVVRDFRIETTRGVRLEVLTGLSAPEEYTRNIELEIDRVPHRSRSIAYKNEGIGISELRRMVNRISADSPTARAMESATTVAPFFLDHDLCPELRSRFVDRWEALIRMAREAIRVGTVEPMDLPYAPPDTIFSSYDTEMERLGDIWDEQNYDLNHVNAWLEELAALVEPAQKALEAFLSNCPSPGLQAPVRCSHHDEYMTWAPVSIPPPGH